MMNFNQHIECLGKLLAQEQVVTLLRRDKCSALCDKYHLAIVFHYFLQARFNEEDYTPKNFFLALAISHDLYEDCLVLRYLIEAHYLRDLSSSQRASFSWEKLLLLERMDFKGLITKNVCEKLCKDVQHDAFTRTRSKIHSGIIANKHFVPCKRCKCPTKKISLQEYKTESDKGIEEYALFWALQQEQNWFFLMDVSCTPIAS